MKIFIVKHRYQGHDSEGFDHWEETEVLSYHASLEGAIDKQKELLSTKYKGIYPDNKTDICVGAGIGREIEEQEAIFIDVITVLP
jgi:hypothetical protein